MHFALYYMYHTLLYKNESYYRKKLLHDMRAHLSYLFMWYTHTNKKLYCRLIIKLSWILQTLNISLNYIYNLFGRYFGTFVIQVNYILLKKVNIPYKFNPKRSDQIFYFNNSYRSFKVNSYIPFHR